MQVVIAIVLESPMIKVFVSFRHFLAATFVVCW